MSVFAWLQREWPSVYEAAAAAESAAYPDLRTGCFHARRTLALAVAWVYKHDASLKLPYEDNLSALIHDLTFKATAGGAAFSKARVITTPAASGTGPAEPRIMRRRCPSSAT